MSFGLPATQPALGGMVQLAASSAKPDQGENETFERFGKLLSDGDDAWNAGKPEEALPIYEQALALTAEKLALDPDNIDWIDRKSIVLNVLGDLLHALGRYREALDRIEFRRGLIEMEVAKNPTDQYWLSNLGDMHQDRGRTRLSLNDAAGAVESFKTEVSLRQQLVRMDQNDPVRRNNLAIAYNNLGDAQAYQGAYDDAFGSYDADLKLAQALIDEFPDDANHRYGIAATYRDLANLHAHLNNLIAALQAYRSELAIREGLVEADPGNLDNQWDLTNLLELIGDKHFERREFLSAMENYRKAAAAFRPVVEADKDDPERLWRLAMLESAAGEALVNGGDMGSGLGQYLTALNIARPVYQTHQLDIEKRQQFAVLAATYGYILAQAGRRELAIQAYREALDARISVTEEDPAQVADWQVRGALLLAVGELYQKIGKPEPALEWAGRAADLYERLLTDDAGVSDWKIGRYAADLLAGDALAGLKRDAEAAARYSGAGDAVEGLLRLVPANHTLRNDLYKSRSRGAYALMRLGRHDEAFGLFQGLRDYWGSIAGLGDQDFPNRRNLAYLDLEFGDFLYAIARKKDAVDAYGRALAYWRTVSTDVSENNAALPEVAKLQALIGNSLLDLEDWQGSLTASVEAGRLYRFLLEGEPGNLGYRFASALTDKVAGLDLIELGEIEDGMGRFDAALTQLDSLHAAQPADIEVLRHLVEVHRAKAGQLAAMGQRDLQRGHLERALALTSTALSKAPENALRLTEMQGDDFATLGDSQFADGNHATALEHYAKSIAARRAVVEGFPDHAGARYNLGRILNASGDAYEALGRNAEAYTAFAAAVDSFSEAYRNETDNLEFGRFYSIALNNAARMSALIGLDDGRGLLQQSLEIIKAVSAKEPANRLYKRDVTATLFQLGDSYWAAREMEAAFATYQELHAIRAALAESAPEDLDAKRDVGVALERLGHIRFETGQNREALEFYNQYLAVVEAALASDVEHERLNDDIKVALLNIGGAQAALGDKQAAADAFARALAHVKARAAAAPERVDRQFDVAVVYAGLGDMHRDYGYASDARDNYANALKVYDSIKALDPDNPAWPEWFARIFQTLGDISLRRNDIWGGLKHYETMVSFLDEFRQRHPDDIQALRIAKDGFVAAADKFWVYDKQSGAMKLRTAALEAQERIVALSPENSLDRRNLNYSRDQLATSLLTMGQKQEAMKYFWASLKARTEAAEQNPDNTDYQKDLLYSHRNIGHTLLAGGDAKSALKRQKIALEITENLLKRDPADLDRMYELGIQFRLVAEALIAADDIKGGTEYFRKAFDAVQKVVDQLPENSEIRQDLTSIGIGYGDALRKGDDPEGAIAIYRRSLGLSDVLVQEDPANPRYQNNLAVVTFRLALVPKSGVTWTQVAALWQDLMDKGLLERSPEYTNSLQKAHDRAKKEKGG